MHVLEGGTRLEDWCYFWIRSEERNEGKFGKSCRTLQTGREQSLDLMYSLFINVSDNHIHPSSQSCRRVLSNHQVDGDVHWYC